jgi:hypothetical protein
LLGRGGEEEPGDNPGSIGKGGEPVVREDRVEQIFKAIRQARVVGVR